MHPGNGQEFERLAVSCWERVFRDKRLTPAQQTDYITTGIEAAARALELDADSGTALVFKSILLRIQASAEANLEKRQHLLSEADSLHNSAQALAKKRVSGL